MNIINNVIEALEDVKLENIEVYDLKGSHPLFDYVIVSTATNKRQLKAAIDKIYEKKIEFDHIEGKGEGGWVLIDMKDIIVNIMTREARELYSLDTYLSSTKNQN